jgi:hypothetical protein
MKLKVIIGTILLTLIAGCQNIERYMTYPVSKPKKEDLTTLKQTLADCQTDVSCAYGHYDIAMYYLEQTPTKTKTLRRIRNHLQQANNFVPKDTYIQSLLLSINGWLQATDEKNKLKEQVTELKQAIEKAKAIDLEMANQL